MVKRTNPAGFKPWSKGGSRFGPDQVVDMSGDGCIEPDDTFFLEREIAQQLRGIREGKMFALLFGLEPSSRNLEGNPWSQASIAKRIGVSRQNLCMWESGARKPSCLGKYQAWCQVLETTYEDQILQAVGKKLGGG